MNKKTHSKTLNFQAEVKQLLHLVTHSLYSNKEIFLRELISNASDAADKLRFEAIAKPELYENASELKIWVEFDAKQKTVTVRDNGIGMSHDEIVSHLGTIAKSGTKEFLGALSGDQAKDAHLIGQFGVGFYSSFVVADKVTVKSRRAGLPKEQGVVWESEGTGEFTVEAIVKEDRGTEVILHLKKDEEEFLDAWRLRSIINKYSDHIMLPIVMYKEKDEKSKEQEEEVVNKAQALWTLPKSEIKDEDYKELYKHVTHDFEEPLLWSHNRVEGKLEYISLLYIPTHAPFDLWTREHRSGLKLYVQRVFIMDDAENLLPNYLRFVRGIVDSKDLPLNVSREILQNNKVIEQIRSGLVKRVLDMLEKLATDDKEKYAKFWAAFGQVLKEGLVEDFANRDRIAKLLRFASTHTDTAEQNVAFDDYIARMTKEQDDKIYYLIADGFTAAKHSPHLELFRKKAIEVVLMYDRIDEWVFAQYQEYSGKKLVSITKGDLDVSKFTDKADQEKTAKAKDAVADIVKRMQTVLGDKVKEVRTSERLTNSPACVVTGEHEMSLHLQRIMEQAGQKIPKNKPILEINPTHRLIVKLKDISDDQLFADWTNLFLDQAVLAEGGKLEDAAEFVRRMNELL